MPLDLQIGLLAGIRIPEKLDLFSELVHARESAYIHLPSVQGGGGDIRGCEHDEMSLLIYYHFTEWHKIPCQFLCCTPQFAKSNKQVTGMATCTSI